VKKRPVYMCKRSQALNFTWYINRDLWYIKRDLYTCEKETCVHQRRPPKERRRDVDSFDKKRRNLYIERDLYAFEKETCIHQRRPV